MSNVGFYYYALTRILEYFKFHLQLYHARILIATIILLLF